MNRALHCASALLADGWREGVRLVLDEAGFITAAAPGAARAGDQRLAGAVLPGMPNLHSHGFQRLIAGLTGQRGPGENSFWSWREAMYGMARRIGPQALEACMAAVFLDMLRAGYTACAEFHYLHLAPDGTAYANPAELSERVFAAAATTGIALTHLPVLYLASGFGRESVSEAQRRFPLEPLAYAALLEHCDALAARSPLWRVGMAPHSLRAVPVAALARLVQEEDAARPLHIHVAEQPREVEECRAALGAPPVAWLLDNLPVDARWCLVHATHMEAAELRAAAASGAVAGLCPTTEADLGDGTFDAAAWQRAGGAFGIGSDSNLRLCPAEELRALEFSQRLASGARNVLATGDRSCGRWLFEQAAAGGARALGQDIGVLAPGRRADLLELDTGHPLLEGLAGDALLDAWLFAGGPRMLRSVWVAGRRVIDHGHHPAEERIRADFRSLAAPLRAA